MTTQPAGVTPARILTLLVVAGAAAACSDAAGPAGRFNDEDRIAGDRQCSIPRSEILPGGPGKDGIPALTDPDLVRSGGSGLDYLTSDSRVIGIETPGQSYAIPLNILWWHEIVNLNLAAGLRLAVTHCPLTGSSLAFDRAAIGDAEFGVSGLLYRNNLIMYDRTSEESLWPQMSRGARCGPRDGTSLKPYPVIEMEWGRWQQLHPGTLVMSDRTGYDRDYTLYPYGSYDHPDNGSTLFPVEIDPRRPPKERILGIAFGEGGKAYPFGLLDALGPVGVVNDTVDNQQVVIFWSRPAQAAMAYLPPAGDDRTFEVIDGAIVDRETGSEWTMDGRAVSGARAGTRLLPLESAYVAYWFAWAVFQPDAGLWAGPAS